ncbi:MAG: phosphate ABC transporter permease subunit PstC [Deltaproteobacteria bacterium]|jgi:phosphate transport system permease protein|nr:phosphate ABC transporter permease subunit PstC [Deltaproteobacteria bacterium]
MQMQQANGLINKAKGRPPRTAGSLREAIIRRLLGAAAACSLLFLALIVIFLCLEGLPAFQHLPISEFFLGMDWYPTSEPAEFGIFPLIAGSAVVTLLASALAIPLGVMTAVWLTEIAPSSLRRICKPFIELLAAIPSVVIGLFGMVVIAPILQNYFGADTGLNLLNAGLMLAFMSVPTICSVSEDSLYAVPPALREASLALGATRWQTTWRVVLPAAFSGIGTACMLGMSRSIGETMVVLMVAGGAGIIPISIFDPVRPMPAAIAAEIAEAPFQGEHYYVLFAIGIVLFAFTMLFNIIAQHITENNKRVAD